LRVHEINPLLDERWTQFLERHSQATVFHTAGWLEALRRTYGYGVSAMTTSSPGEHLTNALVFCRIQSWLTGRRLVSVPFSDHCAPLVEDERQLGLLLSGLKHELDQGGARYLEIRPVNGASKPPFGMTESATFCLHRLDLRPSLAELFHSLHGSCIRRKIKRGEREGLTYEEGRSEDLLDKFFQLVVLTRQRHRLAPQPITWFRNLIACLGDQLKIRLASYEGQPAASILTLRYKNTMVYKYGCSDQRFHKLGPMQFLMWHAIQEAKKQGLMEFDLGRSDWDNKGLLTFKDRWDGVRSTITYLRYAAPNARGDGLPMRVTKRILSWTPNCFLPLAGQMLYRHIA
jgi:CelD/BcsL family acetyltransferase involved in cellulose biosynthesis